MTHLEINITVSPRIACEYDSRSKRRLALVNVVVFVNLPWNMNKRVGLNAILSLNRTMNYSKKKNVEPNAVVERVVEYLPAPNMFTSWFSFETACDKVLILVTGFADALIFDPGRRVSSFNSMAVAFLVFFMCISFASDCSSYSSTFPIKKIIFCFRISNLLTNLSNFTHWKHISNGRV